MNIVKKIIAHALGVTPKEPLFDEKESRADMEFEIECLRMENEMLKLEKEIELKEKEMELFRLKYDAK